jgi:hypothetical protein
MSQQGERIGRRLAKRHGFDFLFDPCNFRIASEREGVLRNVIGGQGVMQWVLWIDHEPPTMTLQGKMSECEIGSDHGASTVLKWKHWHVFYDESLSDPFCSPIIWIYKAHEFDLTEVPFSNPDILTKNKDNSKE